VRDARTNRVVGALRDTITVNLAAERFEQIQQRALLYQGGMLLAPGTYKLKFLARENQSGRNRPHLKNALARSCSAKSVAVEQRAAFQPGGRGEKNLRNKNASSG